MTTYVGVFALSAAMLCHQIAVVVGLSLQLFPDNAFFVVSLALLGLGAGGSVVARFRDLAQQEWFPFASTLGYVVTSVCAVALTSLTHDVIVLALLHIPPFWCAGLLLASIFDRWPQIAERIYFADLIGAGLGCLLAVGLITVTGDLLQTTFLQALVGSAAAVAFAATHRQRFIGIATAMLLLAAVAWMPAGVAEYRPDPTKLFAPALADEQANVEHRQWSFLGRVDAVVPNAAFEQIFSGAAAWELQRAGCETRLLLSNGYNWSFAVDTDGRAKCEAPFLGQTRRKLPFIGIDEPSVLVIGAGGGVEVFIAMQHGAARVDAVDLNELMIEAATDWYGDYWGGVWQRPEVSAHVADGRTFAAEASETYDVITLGSVDTGTAQASLLSPNYLYTVEAFSDYLDALTPQGSVFIVRPSLQALRALASATEALRARGAEDPSRHFIVLGEGDLLAATIYREPIGHERLQQIHRAYADGALAEGAPWLEGVETNDALFADFAAAVRSGEESKWLDQRREDLRPTTDDWPYFYQLERDFWSSAAGRLLLWILALVGAIAALALFLPLYGIGPSGGVRRAPELIYFTSLGIGFMFVEIGLIQKLSLVLGHPSYSVTVSLFAMLVASGFGSLLSGRLKRVPLLPLLGLIALLLLAQSWLLDLVVAFSPGELSLRVATTIAVIAPVAFLLGVPFPTRIRELGAAQGGRSLVPWAWAVNGFASVVGSVAAIMISMNLGLRSLFWAAASFYVCAAIARRAAVSD